MESIGDMLERAMKLVKELEEESRRTNYEFSHHKHARPLREASEMELDEAQRALQAHLWCKHNRGTAVERSQLPTARVQQTLSGKWLMEARPSDFKDVIETCINFLYVLNGYDDTMDFVKQMQTHLVDEDLKYNPKAYVEMPFE